MKNPQALPQEFLEREDLWGLQVTVVDYIAGLTDMYAIQLFKDLFVPNGFAGLAKNCFFTPDAR